METQAGHRLVIMCIRLLCHGCRKGRMSRMVPCHGFRQMGGGKAGGTVGWGGFGVARFNSWIEADITRRTRERRERKSSSMSEESMLTRAVRPMGAGLA